MESWRGLIHRYRERLPIPSGVEPVTLDEGNTPLLHAPRLADAIAYNGNLYLKLDGMNPTGSFKDRGMTVAVTAARAEGASAVICASTGNTSASAAAYAARAGLRCLVVIPEGKIALGKLSQAVMHGAEVITIPENFDRALAIVRELGDTSGVTVVNSINPFRLQGQKTAAFEICDTLGRAPDYHALPVGNAGNITAYWMGYSEYHREGVVTQRPRMLGYQAAGAAPIVLGHPVEHPETVATAIRIGDPASWQGAVRARDESKGRIDSVSDEEILDAYRLAAITEGVFCEPASAASIAGLRKAVAANAVAPDRVVVCTLTGHGLKDPECATRTSPTPTPAPASADAIRRLLQLDAR